MTGAVTPVLEIEGLAKHFGGLVALDGIDLSVRQNEILGLIGPNGSGKTTLFNVLTGIYLADAGRIVFNDDDITNSTAQTVYDRGITRTFQRSRLCLDLSIFDNIMVGNHKRLNPDLWFNLMRRKKFRQEFERSVAEAELLVRTFDAPLADRLFDAVGAFPMIDRRRIEICRALISQPTMLLLDEPSAGMTDDETTELMADILEVKQRFTDLTIIIIEHEMGVIERITDHCVVLNFGQKIAEGSYQDIAADPLVQEAYLGIDE
ncbi:MAG: ABC transporter ATP-binding protein [Geminicoccaceae bacterium]